MKTKPSIVFAHGLWADGSCFSKLIVPLQAEGYDCIAAQYGLNTTAKDVAVTKVTESTGGTKHATHLPLFVELVR
jgi:hypothetical protein